MGCRLISDRSSVGKSSSIVPLYLLIFIHLALRVLGSQRRAGQPGHLVSWRSYRLIGVPNGVSVANRRHRSIFLPVQNDLDSVGNGARENGSVAVLGCEGDACFQNISCSFDTLVCVCCVCCHYKKRLD